MPAAVVPIHGTDVQVEIAPGAGGRVHRIVAFGVDVLRTPPTLGHYRAEGFFWGGYVMAPWCNRAPAGPVRLGSRVLDLAANFPDGSGDPRPRPRPAVGRRGRRHVADRASAGQWPWRHSVRVAYTVAGSRFVMELRVENLDDAAMPAGLGWHPWFRSPVDVTIPATMVYESNLVSSVDAVPVHGRFDRRHGGLLDSGIDATWTGLESQQVQFDWPALGVGATMEVSEEVGFVVAAAPAEFDAVAVEPQTHAPDGIRRLLGGEPGAPGWIEPGASLDARVEISFARP
jgi:aldose 1-epimerase